MVHGQQEAMPLGHLPTLSIMLILGPFLTGRITKAFLLLDSASAGNWVVVQVLHAIVHGCYKALVRICFARLPDVA